VRPPDRRDGRPLPEGARPSRSVAKGTRLSIDDLADLLNQLRCICRDCPVHNPQPEPEPEYVPAPPPEPGTAGWSSYLAGLSAELSSLTAAFTAACAAVEGHDNRRVA